MAHDWDPVIDGLRPGSLVEIHGLDEKQLEDFEENVNGQLGQLDSYTGGEIDRFFVLLISGVAAYFEPRNVRAASSVQKSGEGGAKGASNFDILMGPKTTADVLGSEVSSCIFEKGFCVLKICQSARALEGTVEMLRGMSSDGELVRLPEEVEEHYLGSGCKGKVAWLDYDKKRLAADLNLAANDANLSFLAQVFQPYSADILPAEVDERTPALICLTLTDEEEPDFPFPEADDKLLGSFLQTYRRTVLRAVHFMGPGTPSVTLESKDEEKTATLPKGANTAVISAAPNTILLFRPDLYEYSCDAAEEALMLATSLLSPVPQMYLDSVEGDTSWLNKFGQGPPPPAGKENLYVMNSVARLPAYWDNQWAFFTGLKAATDAVILVPLTRWDVNVYWTDNENTFEPWQSTTRHQSFCEGVEFFDNRHFEISNNEAGTMDPVQRLLLEAGAQSLAMIGVTKRMTNRKSIHAGFAVGNDKLDWTVVPKTVDIGGALSGTGTALSIIANRFNFVYNLKGPSFVCDTACSASLSSTHAVRLMMMDREYDCLEWFLTMGAQLCLSAGQFVGCSQAHMSSPKGRSFTFNASADGYLRGEGISGFMLKWGDHRDDSDAILRATMSGQDGRSASITAPNGPAQEEMITRAIKCAHMTPPESTVWECHGTGTSLGDPIEVGAVRKVQIKMKRAEPLMLTSNKTNIGHLEGGAAMGGMVKCIVQCKFTKCCPTLHLRTLNPHLEHAAFDAIFQTEASCYTYAQGHSQVSSFGFGGSNGHAIIWGGKNDVLNDHQHLIMTRIKKMGHAEVRVVGKNPDEWEADFPDPVSCKKGAKFKIELNAEDAKGTPARWEMVDCEQDEDDPDDYYSITGNFNDWSDDRMAPGDVDGLHTITVEVPESGSLEFRFLKEGDSEKVLCPSMPICSRKTDPIMGPGKDLSNKWVIHAKPEKEVKIELFVKRGTKSLMWLVEREP